MDANKKEKTEVNYQLIIGVILLIPPILSVIMFLSGIFDISDASWLRLRDLSPNFRGGDYDTPMPVYFGLMAIAGAYLIKDSRKNN